MRIASLLCSVALLALFALSGCGLGPSPAASPTPTRAFTGSLLLRGASGAYQLSNNPSTGEAEIDRLYEASEGTFWRLSPDRSYIVYYDPDATELRLFDLQAGTDTPLAEGEAQCVEWSPNSQSISAAYRGALDVYDLAGTFVTIYRPPSARYVPLGEVFGPVECGRWIAADRLVFQRYVGTMPGSISIGASSPVDANTTTLAILGNEVTLVDAPRRWFVRDICPSDSLVLLDDDPFYSGVATGPHTPDLFLADDFRDFRNLAPRTLNIELPWDIGFLPNSATCELYALYPHTAESTFPLDMFYLDPATLELRFGYTLGDGSTSGGIIWGGWVWIGDPSEGVIAVEEIVPQAGETSISMFKPGDTNISMINLGTGERTVIANSQTKGWPGEVHLRGWLP